ncbi:MAG: acyltransferase [Ferruginibacter sp.]|nr:acyltransferase [Ferruginibacter sp.]
MPFTDMHYKFKKIGVNVEIGQNVFFRYPHLVEIDDNVIIDEFCYFTTALKIGSYVHISPHCSVIGGSKSIFTMEDFTGLSAGCKIVCSSDNYLGDGLTNPTIPAQFHATVNYSFVFMKKHSLLGTGCIVHPGVTLHEGAVGGSGSLISKDLKEWSINVGTPARYLKERPRETILTFEQELRKSTNPSSPN